MSSGPLAESPWLKRIWERLGAIFDQGRESLAVLTAILGTGSSVPIANLVYARLRDPDNADTPDMNVDASGGDLTYRYTVPDGQRVAVERINFAIANNAKDVPNGFFSLADLGSGDGCLIRAHNTDDSLLIDFLDGAELRRSADFDLLAGVDTDTDSTANLARGAVRWTVAKAGATGILEAGQYIEFTVRADLSGLELFQAMLQGKLL